MTQIVLEEETRPLGSKDYHTSIFCCKNKYNTYFTGTKNGKVLIWNEKEKYGERELTNRRLKTSKIF